MRTCADGALDLWLTTVRTRCGKEARACGLERTPRDVARGQSVVGVRVANHAVRQYARGSVQDVQKLLGCARSLGVEKKLRTCLEALP